MKISLTFSGLIAVCIISACGSDNNSIQNDPEPKVEYDSKNGVGDFENVEMPVELNADLIKKGQELNNTKCVACHKLSSEVLLGPGWKGVTKRKSFTWLMNFLTNSEEMLDKDPDLKKQIELFKVRMPDQNLSKEDAFAILELMRDNDKN